MPRQVLFSGLVLFCLLGLFLFGCTGTPRPASSTQQPAQQPTTPPVQPAPQQNTVAPSVPASVNNTVSTIQNTSNATAPTLETKPETRNTKPAIVRGRVDSDFEVSVYDENRSVFGTTLMADNHISGSPRVIEVNMLGEIVWEYKVPKEYSQYTNPGFDVEPLANGNVMIVLPRKGIFEINKQVQVVWSYLDSKISHDADRLPNGNTLFVYGASDRKTDAQVKEVDSSGNVVWSWYAKDSYDRVPYVSINEEGWTHMNAVTRLPNGNTLISPRNFDMLIEIDPAGRVVRETTLGGVLEKQHDPEVQVNGTILLANHAVPNVIYLIDWSDHILWNYTVFDREAWPVRDANMLKNGNVLITGTDRVFEVTPDKQIVWMFKIKNPGFTQQTAPALGFYKAERLPE